LNIRNFAHCILIVSGGTPCNVNIIYNIATSLKSTFSGIQWRRRQSSFVYTSLPTKSAKSREIPRQFQLIAVQGHPRPSSLVPIENVIGSNFGRISYYCIEIWKYWKRSVFNRYHLRESNRL